MVIYVVLYTQCLRYNICSAWFLDIRISTYSCISLIRQIEIIKEVELHLNYCIFVLDLVLDGIDIFSHYCGKFNTAITVLYIYVHTII